MVNRHARRALLLVIAAAVGVSLSAPLSGHPSADLFTDIYNRGVAKQKTMRSLSARFTETTTSSLLVRPLVAHGTVIAAAPARVQMTYTDPERKVMTMDGKVLVITWPDRAERQQINISDIQKRIDHYFTNANVGELRSMFEIKAQADPVRRGNDLIEMRPTRKQIKQGLEHLELWIDRERDLLTQIRMTFPGGDQKTIALDDMTMNVPVTDDMFRGR